MIKSSSNILRLLKEVNKKMSKKFLIMFIVIGLSTLTSCVHTVNVGHVGLKVHQLGGDKGVDTEVLPVGMYWFGFMESFYEFPTYQQTYTWTKNPHEGRSIDESLSFQTSEGLDVNADIGISYSIDPDKAAVLFQKFRRGLDEITDIYLRNYVRDSLVKRSSSLPIEAVYGKGKTDLIQGVENDVRSQVKEYGINIDKIYWIGSVRIPDQVLEALNSKVQATQEAQKRENQVAQARASAEIKIAEARGEAESLRIKQSALTHTLLEYEKIKTQQMAIDKWNGVVPGTLVGSGTYPFLNIGGK